MFQDKDKSVVEIVKEVKQDILYADEFVYEVCTSFKEHLRYDDEDYIMTHQDKVHIKNLVNDKIDGLQEAFTQEYSTKFQPYITALNDIENTLSDNVQGGSSVAILKNIPKPMSQLVSRKGSCRRPTIKNNMFSKPLNVPAPSPLTSPLQMSKYNTANYINKSVNNNFQNVNVKPLDYTKSLNSPSQNVFTLNSERNTSIDCNLIDDELITYIHEIIDDVYDLLGERNMSLARRLISLFYDVDLMEMAITNVKNRQQGGKQSKKRKLKQKAGSLGDFAIGKSMDFAMGKLKGLLTEKTKEVYEKVKSKHSKQSKNKQTNVRDEEQEKNESWFAKFFKQSAELTKLDSKEVDAEYQKLVKEFNQSTLGKVIEDFKGYPFFSQPFYVRSFLWRLLLKGCFGRRYMMFGEHKGFIFDQSVFYRMETWSQECTRRKEEIKKERDNLLTQIENSREDFDVLYGFADEPQKVSKLAWQTRKKMLLKKQKVAPINLSQSQELALKNLDYDLMKRLARVVVDCDILHPIKSRAKEEANSKFKPNEDEDKKKFLATGENVLNKTGNEELLKDIKGVVAKKEELEKSFNSKNAQGNKTQNAANNNSTNMDPEKLVSGLKNKIYDSIKELFVDMSGHILKTLSLSGIDIKYGLRIVGQHFMDILLQVLPGPLINIASAIGAFPVGIVEVGLGLLIMIVVHSYSYYKQRAHMLKAKLNISQKQFEVSQNSVVPFVNETLNVGYKVQNKTTSSIVFSNLSSSFDTNNSISDKVVVFNYPIQNPLFQEYESLINQCEEVFDDETLANINTGEIESNDLVQYFYQDMQGGKKKRVLSKKQYNEINNYLQTYTTKQLKLYLQNTNIQRLQQKQDKQSMIDAIIKTRFINPKA
jgi:hypothetical protein